MGQRHGLNLGDHPKIDWENLQEPVGFYYQIWGYPPIVPLNQSTEICKTRQINHDVQQVEPILIHLEDARRVKISDMRGYIPLLGCRIHFYSHSHWLVVLDCQGDQAAMFRRHNFPWFWGDLL